MLLFGSLKILLYSQFCTPEPIFKSVPFARELNRRGHDVRILTGFPNYPSGELHPGYRLGWRRRETIDGVPVLRVPLYPDHSKSVFRRAANYLSFMAASAPPLLGGWRPDVVYVYNLVTLGLVASWNQRMRGIPYVIDVQDLWPDSVFQSGMGKNWMGAVLRRLCRTGYGAATGVVGLSPGMVEALAARGVERRRLRCIYNWCDESALKVGAASSNSPLPESFAGRFNILYAGNMGTVQGLHSVIEAAQRVAQVDPRIQFVFMGNGLERSVLEARAQMIAPKNTLFLAACPLAEAAVIQAQSHALLIHLQPNPLFEITIPSKTQAYLASGRPVLAAVGRDARQLVERSGGGIGCEPGNPAAIAHAALSLAALSASQREEMGRRGAEYYFRELALGVGVTHWEKTFAETIAINRANN